MLTFLTDCVEVRNLLRGARRRPVTGNRGSSQPYARVPWFPSCAHAAHTARRVSPCPLADRYDRSSRSRTCFLSEDCELRETSRCSIKARGSSRTWAGRGRRMNPLRRLDRSSSWCGRRSSFSLRQRLAIAFLALTTIPAVAQKAVPLLPDTGKTPGRTNPAVDQAKLCNSSFATKPFRKASKSDRKCVVSRYGRPSYAFTYDHLVPLELGGLDGCDNLWPEPRVEARMKDKLEDAIRSHVCVCHDLTLAEGQELFRRDWRKGYAIYVTPKYTPMCETNRPP